jgi:hypothetical protein
LPGTDRGNVVLTGNDRDAGGNVMKLLKMRTLGVFGLGFLAGSRAGQGPWEKAQAGIDQIKDKVGGTSMGTDGNGSMSSNGFEGQRSQNNPQMTEI